MPWDVQDVFNDLLPREGGGVVVQKHMSGFNAFGDPEYEYRIHHKQMGAVGHLVRNQNLQGLIPELRGPMDYDVFMMLIKNGLKFKVVSDVKL